MVPALTIYVAGPYTADSDAKIWNNVVAAIDAGILLYRKGHYPYIPHLTHFVETRSQEVGAGLKWEDYIKWDRVWLKQCDAFLHLGSSRGADLELRWAKEHGLKIFYSLEDVPIADHLHEDDDFINEISRDP
jgi:hypothetical protein